MAVNALSMIVQGQQGVAKSLTGRWKCQHEPAEESEPEVEVLSACLSCRSCPEDGGKILPRREVRAV